MKTVACPQNTATRFSTAAKTPVVEFTSEEIRNYLPADSPYEIAAKMEDGKLRYFLQLKESEESKVARLNAVASERHLKIGSLMNQVFCGQVSEV